MVRRSLCTRKKAEVLEEEQVRNSKEERSLLSAAGSALPNLGNQTKKRSVCFHTDSSKVQIQAVHALEEPGNSRQEHDVRTAER